METESPLNPFGPGSAEKLAAVRIDVQFDGVQAIAFCGQLQLALRHPENGGDSAVCARRFIDHCIDVFEHEGLKEFARLIRLGYDPAFDGVI